MSNGINTPYGLIPVDSISGSAATRRLKAYSIPVDNLGVTSSPQLFCGDHVRLSTNGTAGTFTNGALVAAITPVAGQPGTLLTGRIIGVFNSCEYQGVNDTHITHSDYLPANLTVRPGTQVFVFVNDDPDTIYKMQMSTSTNNATLVNNLAPSVFQNWMRGQNANIQVGGTAFTAPAPVLDTNNPTTGNANSHISGFYLDGSTISMANAAQGNANFDVKIIGLAPSAMIGANLLPKSNQYAGKLPGNGLPFCDVLVKINYHVFANGVAGPFNAA